MIHVGKVKCSLCTPWSFPCMRTRTISCSMLKQILLSLEYVVVHLSHYQTVQYNINKSVITACLIYIYPQLYTYVTYKFYDSCNLYSCYKSHAVNDGSTLHYVIHKPGRQLTINLINVSHISYSTPPIYMY
jgi:hypothetical protein